MKQIDEIKEMIRGMMAQEMETFKEALSNGESNETSSHVVYTMLQVLLAKIEQMPKVWHDVSEEPEDKRPIFVTTEYNEFFMSPNKPDRQGRGFSHYKKLSNYKQWAYVDDFLPLGWKTKQKDG